MPVDKERIAELARRVNRMEYLASTGMAEGYPITTSGMVAAPVAASKPEEVVEDLFSEEAMARRALKQRYAESNFDNKAKSHAGAMGAWQIMPITYKDYLGRGRGKAGDLNDPEYNRKVRDWVMGIIPRDLQDLYSENDAPRVKLAKIYGAYNWGAGNMRKYLRKQREAGVDISNDTAWVEGLNPETKRYIKYLALDEDIPDSTYTNRAFEEAAAERGYMKDGGKIYIKPSHRGRLTELKEMTGKTEAELYNDGNPAHKKMVVFARNARKWHGDGGLLDKLGSVYGNDRARMLDAIKKVKQNRFDGGGEKGDSTIVEELKPAVVTAYKEEPLYLDEPYVDPKDFFTRWYPNRRAQMADNMANYRSWVTGWSFGQRRRAEKNVDTYIDSMLRNNDNVKQYILKGPHIWGSYENYDFPNALNDPEARKILSEHVTAKYNLLGKEIPKEGFDDWDLRMEMYGANGFSYDNDKYHVFYAEPNPSMGTQFHELSHTLRSVPGELPKYDTSFGYNPITYQIDKIQEDLIKRPGLFAPINATNDYSHLVTPYGLEMKKKEPDDFRYYMTEEEVKARLNAVRANQGINPRRTITEDDLKEIKKRASDSDHKFLDFYTDEALLRFFNDVATTNNETLLENYAEKGGRINRKK